jgi:hypothetical protein
MNDHDDLRKRVEHWLKCEREGSPLIRDLWAWGQEKDAEATAWKHANAFEPVTAEELAEALGYDYATVEEFQIVRKLGPLYRQRKL